MDTPPCAVLARGMHTPTSHALRNLWYVAMPAAMLARGAMQPLRLLGEPVLLGRGNDGTVFALRDFCPHRGIPLHHGRFDGCEVECCYHGWRFNMHGTCTAIPSLADDKTDISKIKTGAYPCHEQDGLIWIYMADASGTADMPAPPTMPITLRGGFKHVESVTFPCDIDHAVIGLMDPSHGPYVHRAWWWRSTRSMHVKEKQFAPRPLGFAMVRHSPSSNSRAYRILGGGGGRSTEIAFQLPGLRTEHITLGAKNVLLLTALTPVSDNETQLHQFIYSDIGFVNAILPLVRPFGKRFIAQDMDIVTKQQEGLKGEHPPLMLLGDADAQALWYYRLKKEYIAAQSESRPFTNPLKERTLRWRS